MVCAAFFGGMVWFTAACSDELSQDTYIKVVVRGFEKEPVRDALGTLTPKSVSLELAQITLLKSDENVSESLITAEQTETYDIISRDTKVYNKKLATSLLNTDYQSIGVYFKVTDGDGEEVFLCRNAAGEDLIPSVDALDAACNAEQTLCLVVFSDFTPSLTGIGGVLSKNFTIKKAEDLNVSVQLSWKNTISSDGNSCMFPDFEVVKS